MILRQQWEMTKITYIPVLNSVVHGPGTAQSTFSLYNHQEKN